MLRANNNKSITPPTTTASTTHQQPSTITTQFGNRVRGGGGWVQYVIGAGAVLVVGGVAIKCWRYYKKRQFVKFTLEFMHKSFSLGEQALASKEYQAAVGYFSRTLEHISTLRQIALNNTNDNNNDNDNTTNSREAFWIAATSLQPRCKLLRAVAFVSLHLPLAALADLKCLPISDEVVDARANALLERSKLEHSNNCANWRESALLAESLIDAAPETCLAVKEWLDLSDEIRNRIINRTSLIDRYNHFLKLRKAIVTPPCSHSSCYELHLEPSVYHVSGTHVIVVAQPGLNDLSGLRTLSLAGREMNLVWLGTDDVLFANAFPYRMLTPEGHGLLGSSLVQHAQQYQVFLEDYNKKTRVVENSLQDIISTQEAIDPASAMSNTTKIHFVPEWDGCCVMTQPNHVDVLAQLLFQILPSENPAAAAAAGVSGTLSTNTRTVVFGSHHSLAALTPAVALWHLLTHTSEIRSTAFGKAAPDLEHCFPLDLVYEQSHDAQISQSILNRILELCEAAGPYRMIDHIHITCTHRSTTARHANWRLALHVLCWQYVLLLCAVMCVRESSDPSPLRTFSTWLNERPLLLQACKQSIDKVVW